MKAFSDYQGYLHVVQDGLCEDKLHLLTGCNGPAEQAYRGI